LLAISEADELVCFSVYGTVKIEFLGPLFREYDRAFATQLGMPLFGGPQPRVMRSRRFSRARWDDSAWNEVVQ
jgi:hypothetical protein